MEEVRETWKFLFETSTTTWIILAAANLPVYFFWAWVLFRSWGGFFDAVKFWLTPDIVSAFNGEWGEDQWAELRLGFWVILCLVSVVCEAYLLYGIMH